MRLKSAYREKPPAVQIDDQQIQPSEQAHIEFTDKADPLVAIDAAMTPADTATPTDEATLALQKQLADLKKSEELQRQQHEAAMLAAQAQPPTREQLLQAWRGAGADEGDLAFMEANPELIDNPRLTRIASDEAAQQGHERGTDAHRQATKENFDRHLARLQAQPAASVQPTPAFFQPPEPSRSPAVPDRAAMYSAPVSRGAPGAGYREPSPRSVKLSPLEQELARNLGLSDATYAANKLKMLRERASGERE